MTGPRIPGEGLCGLDGDRGHEPDDGPRVGVLSLQGDVLEHLRMLAAAGVRASTVRRAEDLEGLDGLVVPGGESTTIGRLACLYGLLEPLRRAVADGLPVLGTCAGAILLSRQALHHDGRPSEQPLIGGMDVVARRNAFGRQVASFEAEVWVSGIPGGPVQAAFIRAPWIEEAGPDAEVLATVETPLGDRVVVVRQGRLLAAAFHPELTGDGRLHALFVDLVAGAA